MSLVLSLSVRDSSNSNATLMAFAEDHEVIILSSVAMDCPFNQ